MKTFLTKRKQAWVERRKPDVVRGKPLNPSAMPEMRYSARLQNLIDRMTTDVEKQVKRLFSSEAAEQYFAQDISIAAQSRMLTNALLKKYEDLFAAASKPMAETMANQVDAASSASLHTSLRELSGGLSLSTTSLQGGLSQIMSATITENVSLIRTIPAQYLAGVQQAVMRSIATGNGLQDLVPYLEKHKGITHRRAQLIASDQTRKAFNNLNRGRMEKLGVKKFEWLHTGGSREPRKLHKELSGQIFSFDKLPVIDENSGERGIPGQAINCRCRMIPVLDLGGKDD